MRLRGHVRVRRARVGGGRRRGLRGRLGRLPRAAHRLALVGRHRPLASTGARVAWNLVAGVHDAPSVERAHASGWTASPPRCRRWRSRTTSRAWATCDFTPWCAREDHTRAARSSAATTCSRSAASRASCPAGVRLASGHGVMEWHDVQLVRSAGGRNRSAASFRAVQVMRTGPPLSLVRSRRHGRSCRAASRSGSCVTVGCVAMKIRAAVLEEFAQPLVVQDVELDGPGPGEVLVRLAACGVCHTDMYTASGADPSGYAPDRARARGRRRGRGRGRGRDEPRARRSRGHALLAPVPRVRALPSRTRRTSASPSARSRTRATCPTAPRGSPRRRADPPLHGHQHVRRGHGDAGDRAGEGRTPTRRSTWSARSPAAPPRASAPRCTWPRSSPAPRARSSAPAWWASARWPAAGWPAPSGSSPWTSPRSRLEQARAQGATDTLVGGPDAVEQILEMTGGFGADYTFEATGNVAVMRQAVESARMGWGLCTVAGVAGKGEVLEVVPRFLITGRRIAGASFGGAKGRDRVPELVDRYLAGDLDLDSLDHAAHLARRGERRLRGDGPPRGRADRHHLLGHDRVRAGGAGRAGHAPSPRPSASSRCARRTSGRGRSRRGPTARPRRAPPRASRRSHRRAGL